jgi:cobalt-zinc-cadmium efflux system membrane fusion protein
MSLRNPLRDPLTNLLICAVLVMMPAAFTGCGQSEPAAPATQTSTSPQGHTGWWCDEHGVPEEICALCDGKLVGKFKAKGDWCDEHDRPESQCFACHPEYEAKFAAQYQAKYGRKPPKPQTEEAREHDEPHS